VTGIPGRSARRSRRGYYFQDLWALHCCIEMLEGIWTSVTSDGHEDVTCENSSESLICYVQVKTEEHPDGVWTVAKLCQPDGGGVETSILGKLFVDKPLPDGARFELVGNVALNRELAPLEPQAIVDRGPVEAQIARRLVGLTLADRRSVSWCLERLTVRQVGATAESLEDRVLRLLGRYLSERELGLLAHETEELLAILISMITTAARAHAATPLERAVASAEVDRHASRLIQATQAGTSPISESLADKLRKAGLDEEQIDALQAAKFSYSRGYRTALTPTTRVLDQLADEIRMRCVSLTLAMREGTIQPGAEMWEATRRAVEQMHRDGSWDSRGIPLSQAFGALHEITDRCHHRYAP
jgi:hypothetical protein